MHSLKFLLVLTIAVTLVDCQKYILPTWRPPRRHTLKPIILVKIIPKHRHTRQAHIERQVGGGKVFGNLGTSNGIPSGQAGYQRDILNNNRGHLQGTGYGTKTLGDPSRVGGRLDYNRGDRVSGFVDANRNIHGKPNWQGNAGARWSVDKNTDITGQGIYNGRKDYGVGVGLNHRF